MHDRPRRGVRVIARVVCAIALVIPAVVTGQEPSRPPVVSWETGDGKSYVIPAAEVAAFIAALNFVDRNVLHDWRDYDVTGETIWRNLRTKPVFDRDPFSVNQIGHPYQGNIYYGAARSAGLSYWESLLYTIGGSFVWEIAGETTRPSINDHVATGIGGSFVGEAAFRMASLLLEGGGAAPGFWRELGAALISPPTGFNRLVFGDRFKPIFPSHDPEVFLRVRVGATLTSRVKNAGLTSDVHREEGSGDYALTYGLPGKPGYTYTRPFDYFHFEFTAVPNAHTAANALENVSIRGLLAGRRYEALGDDARGVWGLFGSYEYLSPQVFRVATTAVSLGSVAQWWAAPRLAVQGTLLGGLGFGAAGTVADRAERDYHYGLIPEIVAGLRLIFGERAMLEGSGRQYFVAGTGTEGGVSTDKFGRENIARGQLGFTLRISGPHAVGLQYMVTTRDTRTPDLRDRHQLVETVTLSYNFLGNDRFGATEWRRD